MVQQLKHNILGVPHQSAWTSARLQDEIIKKFSSRTYITSLLTFFRGNGNVEGDLEFHLCPHAQPSASPTPNALRFACNSTTQEGKGCLVQVIVPVPSHGVHELEWYRCTKVEQPVHDFSFT